MRLPQHIVSVIESVARRYGALLSESEDRARAFARLAAEQVAFQYPDEGWGLKRAGAGRPQGTDTIARLHPSGRLEAWDYYIGAGQPGGSFVWDQYYDAIEQQGQQFITVTGVNHLGAGEPVPTPLPVPTPTPTPAPEPGEPNEPTTDQVLAVLLAIATDTAASRAHLEAIRGDLKNFTNDVKAQLPDIIKAMGGGGVLGGLFGGKK